MKRKIVLSFLAVLIISALGSAFAILYIRNTTATLGRFINIHQSQDIHQHLVLSVRLCSRASPLTPTRPSISPA